MAAIKILVVGNPASIHTARFCDLLIEAGYQIQLFHSEFDFHQDEQLKNTPLHIDWFDEQPQNDNTLISDVPLTLSSKNWLFRNKRLFNVYQTFRKMSRFAHYPRLNTLLKVIKNYKPDLIISLKMQNEGYLVSDAKESYTNSFTPWLHFCWGTDIEFFGKNKDYKHLHLPLIKKVLNNCDYFMADSERDIESAKKIGLQGKSLGFFLANGGYDGNYLRQFCLPFSKRNIILVKGREGGLVGRAFVILKALHELRDEIKDFSIKVVMPTPEVVGVVNFLKTLDMVDYEIVPRISYDELLKLFGRSRIAIGASEVDGTPSFLTESIVMGAVPIYSNISSIDTWIKPQVNGFLFNNDDEGSLKENVLRSLRDDELCKSIIRNNRDVIDNRLERKIYICKIKEIVASILN